jgi:radical SAM superfamily enzyme YgiQ (UPF0313 family)
MSIDPSTQSPAPLPSTEHPYVRFLERVEKPSRYVGGEHGEVRKDWDSTLGKLCLAFPDVYDIGMSHLGFKILYKILNDDPARSPSAPTRRGSTWRPSSARAALPLVSLESARPLRDFDVVGFSLQFELTYTNILTHARPRRHPAPHADRGEDDPLVIAGGPTATHPEPLAPFFDAS